MTLKENTDLLRAQYTEDLAEFLSQKYEVDVCRTAAGTLMIPVLDADRNERWIKFSIIIPKNADESEGTDGYSLANDYAQKIAEKAAKKAEKEKKTKKTN